MSNLLDAAGQPRLGNVFFVFFSVFFFVYGFLVKGGACYWGAGRSAQKQVKRGFSGAEGSAQKGGPSR